MGAAVAMAKKKKPGPKPSAEGPRAALIAVKCHVAYKDWIVRYARSRRITPSQLIDIALSAMAKTDGFEQPPDR